MISTIRDKGTPMRYHFRIKDLEVENKHLKAKLKSIEEELALLKSMVIKQQTIAPTSVKLIPKVELKTSTHPSFDITCDTKIYLQRSCRYNVYQFYLTNKTESFEFYIHFDGSDYDNYIFTKTNFKFSSKRQLTILLNAFHKGEIRVAMTHFGDNVDSSIIALNVLGGSHTKKILSKTYWFIGAMQRELSNDHHQILDSLPRL